MALDLSEERLRAMLAKLSELRDAAHSAVEAGDDPLASAIWDNLYEMQIAFIENLLGEDDRFPAPGFVLDKLGRS